VGPARPRVGSASRAGVAKPERTAGCRAAASSTDRPCQQHDPRSASRRPFAQSSDRVGFSWPPVATDVGLSASRPPWPLKDAADAPLGTRRCPPCCCRRGEPLASPFRFRVRSLGRCTSASPPAVAAQAPSHPHQLLSLAASEAPCVTLPWWPRRGERGRPCLRARFAVKLKTRAAAAIACLSQLYRGCIARCLAICCLVCS
jgi:hypothetical protein